MKCPKCGMPRSLNDRLCPRCKYLFDEDRFIGVEPPRADKMASLLDLKESPGRNWMARQPWRRWTSVAAPIIPGLGHAISGSLWRGLAFFVAVATLAGLSVILFDHTIGQMLFGLAVSAHAYSIFDLTPWSRSPDLKRRSIAMAVILGGLLTIYWPFLNIIANRLLRPVRVYQDGGNILQVPTSFQLLILAGFYGAVIWLGCWIAGMISRKQHRDA